MDEHGRSVQSTVTETKSRDDEGSQFEESASGQKNVKCSVRKKKSLRARYAYGAIFLLTNIIAWLFRDYGERILPVLPCKFAFFPFHIAQERISLSEFDLKYNKSCKLRRVLLISSVHQFDTLKLDFPFCLSGHFFYSLLYS